MESLIFYIVFFYLIYILNRIGVKEYNLNNKKLGKFLILLGFVILLTLYGIRYYVGTDYKAYLDYYNIIKYTSWNDLFNLKWEKGFLIILKTYSYIIKEPKLVFFLFGFLTIFPIYKVNEEYNYKYLPLSILIYCFIFLPFSFNGMRQAVAMSFMICSFDRISNKKIIRGIVIALIAIFLHKSSIILMPYIILLLINNKKIKNFKILSTIVTIIVSLLILFVLKDFLINREILSYNSYLNRIDIKNISYKPIIIYIPIILLLLFFNKKTKSETLYSTLLYNGIIFEIIGSSAQYLSRIALYFSIFEIILIPIILENLKIKFNKKVLNLLYIIYLILYFYIQFYIWGKHEIIPYQTWIT